MIIEFNTIQSICVYIVIFLLTSYLFSKLCTSNIKKSKKKLYFILVLLPIVTLFAYHYCGTDIKTYENIMNRYGTMSYKSIFTLYGLQDEIGFTLLVKFFYDIGGINLVQFVIGSIIIYPVYLTLIRYSKKINVFTASNIFLFSYFITSLNIMRQMMAVSLTFFAIYNFLQTKRYRYIGIIFVSSLIHKSSLIALVIIFIIYNSNIEYTKKRLILNVIISIVLIIVIMQFSNVLLASYDSYIGYKMESMNRDIIIKIFNFVVYLLLYKRYMTNDKNNKTLILLGFLGVIVGVSGVINPYIKRIGIFFVVYEIILFSQIDKMFGKMNRFFIKCSINLLYILYFFIMNVYLLQGAIIPLIIKIY